MPHVYSLTHETQLHHQRGAPDLGFAGIDAKLLADDSANDQLLNNWLRPGRFELHSVLAIRLHLTARLPLESG